MATLLPTAIHHDAALAVYLSAEDEMAACIANVFSDDPDRWAKIATAERCLHNARASWLACGGQSRVPAR